MIRCLALCLLCALPAAAQEAEAPMSAERLIEIVVALDPDARLVGGGVELTIADVPVLIIMDEAANRMRAMVPIRSAEGLTPEDMQRLMQANFDAALDARYAIAQGRLWGVFIHPLAQLEQDQFISGLAQTVTVAQTYGTTYSSGAMVFGGGDSGGLHQRLIEELTERGQDI